MADTRATLIYAVRHGETEWNLIGKQQGHLDSPLTARGREQARALAEGLTGRGIELIYSSDLGRALATAETVAAQLGLAVQTDARLRERHLGELQGLTKDEWRRQAPDQSSAFAAGDPDYCFPGGESARQRYARNVGCVEQLAARHAGQVILVVAHGGVLNSLFCRALDLPLAEPRRFSLFNAAINCFSVSDTWRLDTWGEISHLRDLDTLDDR